jgi:peptidyl-prolyl cis-trans isomerase C
MIKRCFPVAALSLLFFFTLLPHAVLAAPKGQPARDASAEVLAQIGKKVITKADFEARIAALPPEYQNRLKTDAQKKEFLEGFIQAQLLAMEAKTQKMDKKKAIQTRIEDMTTSILAQEYARQVLAKVAKTTDEEVKAYYEKHKSSFLSPATVSAQHILVKVDAAAKPEDVKAAQAKAEGIKKELDAGADFGKLAEKYSDDPGSKAKGGDLGFFAKERMVPEFSQAAFKMKKGEISNPVKSAFGYHIIKVNDIRTEKQMDLKEATPRVRSQLENQARQEAVNKEIDQLKKKYNVMVK